MSGTTSLGSRSLAGAEPTSFWTDQVDAPVPGPALEGSITADLAIIGGGFTGLWTAWRALDRDPERDIVILEGEHIGYGASGRNGGFISHSLTHGIAHGRALWPKDLPALLREGKRNLADLVAQVRQAGIDCDLQETGKSTVAVQPWQAEALEAAASLAAEYGEHLELVSGDAMQADVHSPTYLAGLRDREGTVMVDPAKLAWGMAAHLRSRGVRIFENSSVGDLVRNGAGIRLQVGDHRVDARHAVIATAAYPSPLRRLRAYIMPLYDHALMSEPLSSAQLESLGWHDRQGMTDAGNQFHYYRLSADQRILWGGWDANYYRGGRVDSSLEQRGDSHEVLASHFFETFPQLEGLSFTHRWAGPIDSTARFTAAYGTAHGGRVAYAAGHTGLGVGASRFSADVALDLLAGEPTSRTRYDIVRRKPFPIPPEPIRNPIVQYTRTKTFDADNNDGRRGAWLRLLDTFGVGFNS